MSGPRTAPSSKRTRARWSPSLAREHHNSTAEARGRVSPPPDTPPPSSGLHRAVTLAQPVQRRWVMGKRAPKLPVASAGGAEQLGEEEEKRQKVAITDRDWQSIESAY